jgi:hypothetical protein
VRLVGALILCCALSPTAALADAASAERGLVVSITGGCHDCHTVGYGESEGTIDSVTALRGNPVGFQGPWGTTYAMNLRITAASLSEDGLSPTCSR